MSTTFEVLPGDAEIPSFDQLLAAANSHLRRRLKKMGVIAVVEIEVVLRRCTSDVQIPLDAKSQMTWSDDTYAWFAVPNVVGGTDAYFETIGDSTRETWTDYLKDEKFAGHRESLQRFVDVGHYWTFRRSAGQPGIVNLAYGLLAGALAELTDGLVFSNDSAWVWSLLPSTATDFLNRYLVPRWYKESRSRQLDDSVLGLDS